MIRRIGFAFLAALAALAAPASAQSLREGTFDPAIPTLESHAGYRPGQQITRPEVIETGGYGYAGGGARGWMIRFVALDSLVARGNAWDENRRQLAFKPYLMAQENGRGPA